MSVHVPPSTAEPIQAIAVDESNSLLTGLTTLRVRLVRVADGYVWDWDGSNAFDAPGAAATPLGTLAQVDAVNIPGLYSVAWPGALAGAYTAIITQTGTDAANVPQVIDMRVGGLGAVDATAGAVAQAAALAAVQADLDDVVARLPAALVDGRMDANVGAVAADAITAAALAADAVAEIQAGLATSVALADVAAEVDAIGLSVDALPTAQDVADATLDALLADHDTPGTVGAAVGLVDVAVSTRAESGDEMALSSDERAATVAAVAAALEASHGAGSWTTATGFSTLAATDVWSVGARTLTGVGSSGIALEATVTGVAGAVAGVSSAVALLPSAAAAADAVWDELLAGHALAGSAGIALGVAPPSAATVAVAVWSAAEGTPSAGTMGYALALSRKHVTNRLWATAGTTNNLVLYDDDATTPLLTWSIVDGAGGAVVTPAGSPARRSMGTID